MKKKILFIIGNMETGGVSKSMVSLMNVIDREKYDISLLITVPRGILMDLLPKDLNIITNLDIELLSVGIHGLIDLLRHKRFYLFFGSLLRLFFLFIIRLSLDGGYLDCIHLLKENMILLSIIMVNNNSIIWLIS